MKRIHAPLIALAIGAILLTAGGCGGSSSSPTAPQNNGNGNGNGMGVPHQVTISGFAFSALTVPVGTVVTWKNNDGVAHTATSDPASAFQFDTGNIDPGATSLDIMFMQAGTFPYHCRYHSNMHGTITVQ